MKKRVLALVMAALTVFCAGCGKDPAELVYLKDFKAADYVKLGEYKGLEVNLAKPEVTEDEIMQYVNYTLDAAATTTEVTGRAVQMGDIANIDYVGKMDGVAFDGGTAQGYDLTIGSGQFIPGFEDGCIGIEIGETKDVEVTFPDPYSNPDLAGKPAVFTVTVNAIKEKQVPEFTDEFVKGLAMEGVSTTEEYKNYVKDSLMDQKMMDYESQMETMVVNAATKNCEFKEVPSGMVDRMNTTLTNNIGSYASMYGMNIRSYVAAVYGGTEEQFEETLLNQTKLMAQQYIMMQAIADKEGITISEEEFEKMVEEEATLYGYETVDEYKETIDMDAYKEFAITMKVMDFLAENATVTAE